MHVFGIPKSRLNTLVKNFLSYGTVQHLKEVTLFRV